MAAVRVDVTQRGWGASVVEEVHKRVDTFRVTQVEAVTPIMLDMQFKFSPLFFFFFQNGDLLPELSKKRYTC